MSETVLGQHPDDHAPTRSRNARYGLILFAVYLLFYAGFVAVSAWAPRRTREPFLGGINLAIVYGFALIFGALLLALVYMLLCSPAVAETKDVTAKVGLVSGTETLAETERLVDAELRDERHTGQKADGR